jgi:transposase
MDYGAIDLHKKESQVHILAADGTVIDQRIATTRQRLTTLFWGRPRMRILLEASTESEWVAQHLDGLDHEVIVADPNFGLMYGHRSRCVKTDRRDVAALAEACRHGTYRPTHRRSAAQRRVQWHLTLRRELVDTRTRLISIVRAITRSTGHRIPSGAAGTLLRRLDTLGLPEPIRRFDRNRQRRSPFLSAMSMIGARDNETHSYLEIADALRQYGAASKEDLPALWRRIVFNVLISNTDDHLRNHGFVYEGTRGWRLSPAYDLNPVPVDIKPRVLTTAINAEDSTASIDLAFEVAGYFELQDAETRTVAREVADSVSQWRQQAVRHGIERKEIDRMTSAFEHEDFEKAIRA